MFSIFKRKTNGELAQRVQKEQSLDRTVQAVQRQADEFIEELRRARERRMLRETLGGDGNN